MKQTNEHLYYQCKSHHFNLNAFERKRSTFMGRFVIAACFPFQWEYLFSSLYSSVFRNFYFELAEIKLFPFVKECASNGIEMNWMVTNKWIKRINKYTAWAPRWSMTQIRIDFTVALPSSLFNRIQANHIKIQGMYLRSSKIIHQMST